MSKVELALYQTDIPQNTGTLMRLCACLSVKLHLIEPLGFILNESKMRRAGMDYIDKVNYTRHINFASFCDYVRDNNKRIVLTTTKTNNSYLDFSYHSNDIIMMGRESKGVPDEVHQSIEHKVTIPMSEGFRSLNMAISASMVLAESLRQTNGFTGNYV